MPTARVLSLMLVVAGAAGIAGCATTPPATPTGGVGAVAETVVVTPRTARLVVPLGRASAGTWQWYQPRTPDNRLVFTMPDSAAVATIFARRPTTATLERWLGGARLPDRAVAIVYVPGD